MKFPFLGWCLMLPLGAPTLEEFTDFSPAQYMGRLTFIEGDPWQELGRDRDFPLLTSWEAPLLHCCWQKSGSWGRDRDEVKPIKVKLLLIPHGGDTGGPAHTVNCVYRTTLSLENLWLFHQAVTGPFIGQKTLFHPSRLFVLNTTLRMTWIKGNQGLYSWHIQ